MAPRPFSRRAALAAAALLPATATAAVSGTPAAPLTDLLLDLARAIHAADDALEAACRAANHAEDTPNEAALDLAVHAAHERLERLISQAASVPAAGSMGLAAKGMIVGRAIAGGTTTAERELGNSLRQDAVRLFPEMMGGADPASTQVALRIHPDGALISACAEHVANVEAYHGDDGEVACDPLWLAYAQTRDTITDAKPQTMAGVLAKARAAKAEAMTLAGREDPQNGPAAGWAWDLVGDLLRLGEAR